MNYCAITLESGCSPISDWEVQFLIESSPKEKSFKENVNFGTRITGGK